MKNANGKMLAIFSVLVALAALMSFGSYVGFANTDNVTINVTVQALTEITVTPYNITWGSILPGTLGGERNVTVQNTGSVNATNLYAFMTTLENETARPYSADEASAYSAGGVVVFRNSTIRNMSWAGRIEWNWTNKIANTDWSSMNSATNGIKAEGFIRNVTVQFYWAAANGTVDGANPGQAYCNNTDALLAISDSEDNGTSITRKPTTTGITNNGGDENWSYFSVTRPTSFLAGSCIALDVNCTKIYITNYDKRTGGGYWAGGTTCANANYITAGPITPSQFETVVADVWMPKGVPAGFMKIATWTFVVT